MLRRLFELGCRYSGQVLSYTKMLGQLQDAGNSTTLAHYLDLLAGVGMVCGLQKYAGEAVRQRGSSPKLQVFNTALMTAQSNYGLKEAKTDREYWGHLVESAELLRCSDTYHLELMLVVAHWQQLRKDFQIQDQ